MKKIYWSDIANFLPTVCPSSLDENLEPVFPSNTAHVWDDSTEPVTCSECGTQKDSSHDELPEVVEALEAIRKREPDCGAYEFICY